MQENVYVAKTTTEAQEPDMSLPLDFARAHYLVDKEMDPDEMEEDLHEPSSFEGPAIAPKPK